MNSGKAQFSGNVTECGIPGIASVPVGVHMCHFYPARQELVDCLVPYFKTGLQNEECCIWIAADPLPANAAKAELANVEPRLDEMIDAGQIQILPAEQWYSRKDAAAKDIIQRWLNEEQRALAAGYRALRIAGNTSFVTADEWESFMDYENAATKAFQERRIVTLCSYNLTKCRPTNVLEVVRNHHTALHRRDANWEVVAKGEPILRIA
jgi:hypothetical protein